jgi:hypothetical protein
VGSKWRVLRVATVRLCSSAVAAIIAAIFPDADYVVYGEWLTEYRYPVNRALFKIPELDIHALKLAVIAGHIEQMVYKRRRLGGFKALEFFKFFNG